MKKRLDLHMILLYILGTPNVYFQPPNNLKIQFPCIVYNRLSSYIEHADNQKYILKKSYQVMYITKDPDDSIIDKIEAMELCRFDRMYISDNLYHYVYTLYY